jgi:hypothetical protein
MSTHLGDDAEGLDGFEFLTMAEAGEVGHWAGSDSATGGPANYAFLGSWSGRYRSRRVTSATSRKLTEARRTGGPRDFLSYPAAAAADDGGVAGDLPRSGGAARRRHTAT